MEEHEEGAGENGNQQSDKLPTSGSMRDPVSGIQEVAVITATNDSYPSIHADMEIVALWDHNGRAVSFSTRRYWATRNNRNKGNLSLHGHGVTDWNPKWDDVGQQQGSWITFEHSGSVQVNNDKVPMSWYWRYDLDGGDITLLGYHEFRYRPATLFIPFPPSVVQGRTFTIRGQNAAEMSAVIIVRDAVDIDTGFNGRVLNTAGDWEAEVTIPAGRNSISFWALQIVRGTLVSDRSATVTVTLLSPVVITTPKPNDVISEPRPTVVGTGHNGATIRIYEADSGAVLYGSGTVTGGQWSIPLTVSLPNRGFVFHAEQTYVGLVTWSNKVPVTVQVPPERPVITSPEALSRQNTTFRIGGTGGEAGATMEILRDLDPSIKVGQAAVSGDSWFVDVTDEPGRNGLVARQTAPSRPPVFSLLARAFDIIPPAITGVVVTNPSAGIVQFSGLGFDSATVVFKKISGPVGDTPSDAVVSNGAWQTAVTGWQYGDYRWRAIQTIPNNAGGRIESDPFEFDVSYLFPPPSNVESTAQYRPTISGNGLLGARVAVLDSDKLTKIAPDATVGNDNRWSTTAYDSWGPTWDRLIHVHHFLGDEQSAFVEHKVRIPPIAPGIDSVSPDGLSPTFTGTGEQNAQVNLVFSDGATSYPAVVSGTRWSFQRALSFTPDIGHTVTATQIAAQQTSPAAVRPFQLYRPMVPVVFTYPEQDSEIGHGDVTFKGTGGMKGATVFVWDYVSGAPLGSVTLEADGPWEITAKMTFARWVVRAKQVIDGRESADSDSHVFHVVLLQPEIGRPEEGGSLTRTSMIEGMGEPFGYVDVFLGSATTPFLEKVPIGGNGRWQAEATMPVGDKTIRARQYFQNQTSKDTEPRTYKVVPHPPVMETPAAGDHVGKRAMVSGFGVWGDTVKVKLGPGTGPALGEALVGEDRTWSVPVEILRAGPADSLVATSSEGNFESAASALRPVLAGIFEPSIQSPAEGQSVSNPVHFAGTGQDGEAQLCSWYNPDVILASGLSVTPAAGWQGAASIALSLGGNWSVIQQTLARDQDGATVSDKVTSHRFEVDPVPSEGKTSDIPDKRSP